MQHMVAGMLMFRPTLSLIAQNCGFVRQLRGSALQRRLTRLTVHSKSAQEAVRSNYLLSKANTELRTTQFTSSNNRPPIEPIPLVLNPRELREAEDALYRQKHLLLWAKNGFQFSRPRGTRVIIERSEGCLDIRIPPRGIGRAMIMKTVAVSVWAVLCASAAYFGFHTGSVITTACFGVYLIAGCYFLHNDFRGVLTRQRLSIGLRKFRLGSEFSISSKIEETDFLAGNSLKVIEGITSQLMGSRAIRDYDRDYNDPFKHIVEVVEGYNIYKFGQALSELECKWVVQHINQYIEDVSEQKVDFKGL